MATKITKYLDSEDNEHVSELLADIASQEFLVADKLGDLRDDYGDVDTKVVISKLKVALDDVKKLIKLYDKQAKGATK